MGFSLERSGAAAAETTLHRHACLSDTFDPRSIVRCTAYRGSGSGPVNFSAGRYLPQPNTRLTTLVKVA
jgi:hypothetical protein